MLESKLIKSSQAILKNSTLLICSGSGMTADCTLQGESPSFEGNSVPIFRGTAGLWKHYPVMRQNLVLFDELVKESFFKNSPDRFWYVYGDLHNKLTRAIPHVGYKSLKNIIKVAAKQHWIYHDGVDNLYDRSGFDTSNLTQAKGSLFDWQCKPCNKIFLNVMDNKPFLINRINGVANVPTCQNCGSIMRPNISMRDDLDWIETKVNEQQERMSNFFQSDSINKHSLTILEIGAGPAQPLAREFSEIFLKNDKYRCAVIRINPVKERTSQYRHECSKFEEIVKSRRTDLPNGSYTIDLKLTADEVPDFQSEDTRQIVFEEEKQYVALKNELIEIELSAKDALPLLLKTLKSQKELLHQKK